MTTNFFKLFEKSKISNFFFFSNLFLYLNINCTCSQLSFEVHNMLVAQKFSILTCFTKRMSMQNFSKFLKKICENGLPRPLKYCLEQLSCILAIIILAIGHFGNQYFGNQYFGNQYLTIIPFDNCYFLKSVF